MLVVVLHNLVGEIMHFGPFATYSDALGFVSYMAQFDSFDIVRVVRKNG